MPVVKPAGVIAVHMSICQSAGCTAVKDFSDPCSGCPNGHFGPYVHCTEDQSKLHLGDKVAAVAQPIARGIDSIFGTNLVNCGGCKKRQDALNQLI